MLYVFQEAIHKKKEPGQWSSNDSLHLRFKGCSQYNRTTEITQYNKHQYLYYKSYSYIQSYNWCNSLKGTFIIDELYSKAAFEETVLHENIPVWTTLPLASSLQYSKYILNVLTIDLIHISFVKMIARVLVKGYIWIKLY